MSISILEDFNIYIPTNLSSQMSASFSNPLYSFSFKVDKAEADKSDMVDYRIFSIGFGNLAPKDPYGLREDFGYFDNNMWNVKKLNTPHPTSANWTIDTTLGNRMFGLPILIKNVSGASKNAKISIKHTIGFKLFHTSTVGAASTYDILAFTDGALKKKSDGTNAYNLVSPSTFDEFPLTSINSDVVGLGGNMASSTITSFNLSSVRSYTPRQKKHGKVTSISSNSITITWSTDPSESGITPDSITELYPDNQRIHVIPLGKMEEDTSTTTYTAKNMQQPLSPSAFGLNAFSYAYSVGEYQPGFDDILYPSIANNEIIAIDVSHIKHAGASLFATGFSMGLETY
jgi:hypothetical protein